ncbi:hypothetical protein CsSME_00007063 [Camellia sinensis var. sinensis]
MKDAARMAESYGGDQLLEIPTAEIFAKPSLRDLREQLASLHELQHEVDLRLRSQNLEQPHDVRMTQPAHDRDLSVNMRREAFFKNFLLANGLDRDALACPDVPSVIHLREGSIAEKLSELVFSEQVRRRRQNIAGIINDLWHFLYLEIVTLYSSSQSSSLSMKPTQFSQPT